MAEPARPGSFTGATNSASSGGLFGDTLVSGIPDIVAADVTRAETAATNAATSETNAATSATNAAASAASVGANAAAAAASATAAAGSATSASASATSATASQTSASTSATTATTQATNAAASATSASASATAASTQATNATTQASNALSSANSAAASAASAGSSATAASSSATSAATDAANASTDAATATTQATNAATSASSAATDAAAASTSATNAATSATNAATSETNAATSETNAANSETGAQEWAVQTTGIVDSTDYSSKAWAIGGTGVDQASGGGSAKDWATETTTTADNTEYSAKEYAVGSQAGNTNGSAKQWALGGGNSFALATPVSGADYSARYWADQAASTVANFDEKYYGNYATDALAEDAHEAAGKTVTVGDLYYNTTDSAIKYCTVAPSGTGAPVGTWLPVQATNTSNFATKGFSIAMSIALQELTMAQNFRRYIERSIGTSATDIPDGTDFDSYDTIVGINLANITANAITVSVYISNAGSDYYILKDAPIPSGSALQVLDGGAKFVVASGDRLWVVSDTANSVDVIVSAVDDIST